MVGGVVIGITRSDAGTHVNVAECPHYPKHRSCTAFGKGGDECPNPDTCCVYVDESGFKEDDRVIQLGDSLWWQSGKCYWTPKGNRGKLCHVDFDIPLPKVGYSH